MVKYLVFLTALLTLCACGSSDSTSDDETIDEETPTETPDTDTPDIDSPTGLFDNAMFGLLPLNEDIVSCTLDDGTTTTCYEITWAANGAGDTEGTGTIGPYCPDTIFTPRSESGVGIYDGPTNPGFQSLVDAAQAMDADGYEMVDEDGNINFDDLSSRADASLSYCLSATFDTTLEITYLIPVTPQFRATAYEIGTVESIGFGINGVPLKGNPPSVTIAEAGVGGTGSGNIPSLDLCGGHADPAGYYHWHFVPQSINTVYHADEYDYTDLYGMTCSNSLIAYEDPSAFAGFAKDGFPIYAAYDSVDSVSTDPNEVSTVDQCNGHEHATTEFPDGVYHYHALETGAPNVPQCLMGNFVERGDFEIN